MLINISGWVIGKSINIDRFIDERSIILFFEFLPRFSLFFKFDLG